MSARTHGTATSPPSARILADLSGGLTGGFASAVSGIPNALIATAPLGAAFAGAGVLAAFIGAIVSSALFVALRRTPGLQAANTMPMSLVTAGALSSLVAQGVLDPAVAATPRFVAVMILLTGLSALWSGVIWLSGLGRVVPLIPYPVLAGVVNATAALMMLSQWRHALGMEDGHWRLWPHPGALIVSTATAALMLAPPRWLGHAWLDHVPRTVLALLGGVGIHYAVVMSLPQGFAGPALGSVPHADRLLLDTLSGWALLARLPLGQVLLTLAPAALTIAMLGTLETLLTASTVQDAAGRHGSVEPDLRAIAVANLAGAAAGAVPVCANTSLTMVIWQAGGRTRLAGLTRSAVSLAVLVLLGGALAKLPLAVVAGMVLANASRLVDRESLRLAALAVAARGRSPALAANLAIVGIVVLVAVAFGMAIAVFVGAALSVVMFVVGMAGSVIRRSYAGGAGRSRTTRPSREAVALLESAGKIEIIELQGAIFFGSANHVARQVERALQRGARHVVLDTGRVTSVDLSGARRLLQVKDRFRRDGYDVALAGVRPGTPLWRSLQEYGLATRLQDDRVFAGLEEAVDWAERGVLAEIPLGAPPPTTAIGTLESLGLPATLAAELTDRLPVLRYAQGEWIIRTGDPSDCFFVLLEGSVDVVRTLGEQSGQRVRLSTLMPGLLVGEMGFLSGAVRSADVLARTPVACLRIDAALVADLRATRPEIAYNLMRTIAAQIGHNLLVANAALLASEE